MCVSVLAFISDLLDAFQPIQRLARPGQRVSGGPREIEIVWISLLKWLKKSNGLVDKAQLHLAVAQQGSNAKIAGVLLVQRRELRGGGCEVALLVVGKAEVQAERGISRCLGESNVILGDGLVVTAKRNKNDTKVGMRSDDVGVEPYHLLILAHSNHKVTALLCLRRILKDLLGIRFLRLRTEGTGRHQDEHKGDKDESACYAHVLKYNLKGRPSLFVYRFAGQRLG